jgi:hypothetical protein
MVALYRLETRAADDGAPARRAQPRTKPSTGSAVVLTPRVVTAALLTILVGGLVAYLGYQFVTFARTPDLRIVDPVGDVRGYTRTSLVISGVTEPNARVSVSGLVENPSVVADADGGFRLNLELVPGPNLVTVTALDPRTGRTSPEVTRRIEVVGDPDAGESPPSGSDAAG